MSTESETGSGTGTETENGGVSKSLIAPLLARRRRNLDRDGHITDYDHRRDDDGHKIKKVIRPGEENTTIEREVDVTALEGAAPSTTSNIQLIETEARLLEQGRPIENPHIPSNNDVLRAALDHLRPDDLTPAWEVVDGSAEVSDE